MIVTHARSTDISVRKTDDSRKTARAAAKARKREEKEERTEELDRLKELKRAALVAKLDIIRKNAGAEGKELPSGWLEWDSILNLLDDDL